MFHRVTAVQPLQNNELLLSFHTGEQKRYDVRQLFDHFADFKALQDKALFHQVTVDAGGYGISWNSDLDLSSEELWDNSKPEDTTMERDHGTDKN